MSEAIISIHPSGKMMALVGNPNCGKTALFNLLTGSRQKTGNYAGVTVERKEGRLTTPSGKSLRVLDLPGAYSLYPRSLDESVTCDVGVGRAKGERKPDLVVSVVDATNLRRTLRLTLAIKRLGVPCVVALNMTDMAEKRGIHVDPEALSKAIGLPVVSTVAVKSDGAKPLLELVDNPDVWKARHAAAVAADTHSDEADYKAVRRILQELDLDKIVPHSTSDRIDSVVLHPVIGPILLVLTMFLVFQAVFAWAEWPMEQIEAGAAAVGEWAGSVMAEGWMRSIVVDGVIAGAGGVLVFLPQILILYFFILVLEESGYLPRAAFLLDRLMGGVGLSGRSFIPLLSSFACAIPGIMAARTITDQRDRLVTIMLAPLMTCSARLPVYALLIGAFIPQTKVFGTFELQGLVMLALYFAGIFGAMAVAWCLKRFTAAGRTVRPLMMELPNYHMPTLRNVAIGLWERAMIFIGRVGTVIMALTILLWFFGSFPAPPDGATGPAIEYSIAGMLGHALAVIFAPIGFNWQICVALVPGMAAREVVVGALGTVYSLAATGDEAAQALSPLLADNWSMATALSLLAWFVFAPQCLATLAAVKRETGGWKMSIIMALYLFVLAYAASFITYRVAIAMGLG